MIDKILGHHEVGDQPGRGGMGEVCVAGDLSVDRKVALKFLPEAFTGWKKQSMSMTSGFFLPG